MTITEASYVGQLATEYPVAAVRVFARHNIDYCCGGNRSLEEACDKNGLNPEELLEEIRTEVGMAEFSGDRWDQAPLEELIEHILLAYHKPLYEELPRLELMARKVLAVHGEKDPKRLGELLSVYVGLKEELEPHMAKEEQILFPMIKQGRGAMAGGPISMMQMEHDSAGVALKRLNELTNGYKVPAEACNTWRALWHGLAALEESLHQHIHLENNILFPRALESR